MSRWFLSLILAASCAQTAMAAPSELPADLQAALLQTAKPTQSAEATEALVAPKAESAVRRSLEQMSHTVADQAHSVAGHTSALVSTAMGFMGLRYRRGGNSEETGFDCSGFVRAIYQKTAGLVLPRRASEQAASTQVIDKHDLKPGDLVFFNTMRRAFSHVGVYVGEGKFIHSPRTGQHVRVDDMQSSYWKTRFNGARRVALDSDAMQRMSASASLNQ